ncbi:hypothetical protein [Bosea lupini]|uniref:hypothetical protein n=1 Tax=Bosea lupini TaxID=1036779 RepID=UPI0011606C61|nr:hypothetical protein [Bosea lupini]
MCAMRTIEIDFDVHRKIETERKSFDDTPNDVLRRLLNIDQQIVLPKGSTGRGWSGKGVSLPHGTQVSMSYNGKHYVGLIDNGSWLVENIRFDSPSGAASGVAITKSGRKTRLDGWVLWQVKRPGDAEFQSLSELKVKA